MGNIRRSLVTGCNGQLGTAVRKYVEKLALAGFDYCDVDTFDLSRLEDYGKFDWTLYGTVINCGAYTAVDRAETLEGRKACWAANATGPSLMARMCAEHGITLVHVSSDYVFDGTVQNHCEDEPLTPLSVYGQAKAAGDLAVMGAPRHYVLRSSWVIGEGKNFIKTMKALSDRVADSNDSLDNITVVDDQLGRLTFTDQMAQAIFHVLGYREGDLEPSAPAPYGLYNLTGSGAVRSWADIARAVFERANGNGDAVIPVSTSDYYANVMGPIAPRPHFSDLDLTKIKETGFFPRDWEEELSEFMGAVVSE